MFGTKSSLNRLAIVCLFTLAIASAYGQVTEPQLRAAFVARLGSFWDRTHDGDARNDTIVISVIGDDSVDAQLRDFCQSSSTQAPVLLYRQMTDSDDVDSCNILYIGNGCPDPAAMVKRAESNGCLTIGDEAVAARSKTAVTLFVENSKLHLLVNLDALERANVKLDSRVLRLSNTVRDSDL